MGFIILRTRDFQHHAVFAAAAERDAAGRGFEDGILEDNAPQSGQPSEIITWQAEMLWPD